MAAPFRVGQELELTVDSLAAGGRGVARHEGVVVFVDRALPGDRVMARIQKVKRRHGEAIAFERLAGGPDRIEAPCPHFGVCGGCRWQDLRYERQLEHKQQQVVDALQRIAMLPDAPIEPIVPAVREYAYRNKLEYAWARTDDGPALGFHRAGRWEDIVPVQVCLLTGERGNAVRDTFVTWARGQGLQAYTQRENSGYLRHLVVREGVRTGELLCILVTVAGDVPGVEELQALLAEHAPGVVGVLHAVNDGSADVASGFPTRPLFGRAWFEEEISGLRLRVSAGSFLQTNTEMADVLYKDAIEQAGLTGGEIVWDLYCGTGSIGLALAGAARRVIGIEIVEEAIERARENALANGVANIQFHCADASKAPRDLIAEGLPAPDVIVLDPPRAGMTPKAARRVAELGAKRIVYVSCNPTTLAGNAPILAEGGYRMTRLRPFDLFPHTPHVECVAVFERDPAFTPASAPGSAPTQTGPSGS
ncbi:MAG TPA: 23S rRNA (uracil(1939)-C(5))-methyltransferase RlmD [Gaiellales bacterium]